MITKGKEKIKIMINCSPKYLKLSLNLDLYEEYIDARQK